MKKDWTIGKTFASISFVFAAKRYIKTCKNLVEVERLEKRIADLKSGNTVLKCRQAVKTFLRGEND